MAYTPTPIARVPGMTQGSGVRFGQPNYSASPIGNVVGNELYNPETGGFQRTGAQKGTNLGESLNALAKTTGLPLLGGAFGSGGGAGSGVGSLPPIEMGDTSAANAAAFGRAKDQAGQTGRASLNALREQMAASGLRGSGIEAGEVGKTIGRAAQGVNEFTREQAIQDAGNINQRAMQEYQGRITQRGQDLSAAQANAARQQAALQGLLSALGGGQGLY